jgi:hypothetical protein
MTFPCPVCDTSIAVAMKTWSVPVPSAFQSLFIADGAAALMATIAAGSVAIPNIQPQCSILPQHSPYLTEHLNRVLNEQLRSRFKTETTQPCAAVDAETVFKTLGRYRGNLDSTAPRGGLRVLQVDAQSHFPVNLLHRKIMRALFIPTPHTRRYPIVS